MRTITSTQFMFLLLGFSTKTYGFVVSPSRSNPNNAVPSIHHEPISSGTTLPPSRSTQSFSRLFGGGFGGGDDKNTTKKKKEIKLKPKQQWDRYLSFKTEPKIRVAVRVVEDESDEWLEVGRVKTKEMQYTEMAVARQRAIIAEHAKRLYPLQISNKKTLEWGYYQEQDEVWKIVDKSVLDTEEVEGLEKMIGFEGRPDPSTGFYCVYDEGRLKLGDESSFK
ncbi:hypothetical protein IV203_030760 [Nitzschia inconspicua]|uniref:Uncharacterized protein n=1 Tax=Nitzschia inconspicua TaxID=303405 RepID=A0A9K3LTZ4_9STRA|nr:hypothetical protein IV203_030760 [Nitzschia inconspicua]